MALQPGLYEVFTTSEGPYSDVAMYRAYRMRIPRAVQTMIQFTTMVVLY